MEPRNDLDELITRYLLNEVNEEEKVYIIDWINSDGKNKRYFEKLEATWKLMAVRQAIEKVDIAQEWDQFRQAVSRKESKLTSIFPGLEFAYKNKNFIAIVRNIKVKNPPIQDRNNKEDISYGDPSIPDNK